LYEECEVWEWEGGVGSSGVRIIEMLEGLGWVH
jgi:hypothetical protein